MRLPTVKNMMSRGFSKEQATKIRELMERYEQKSLGKFPRNTLEKISDILGGCGIETIGAGHNSMSPKITYVNMGDSYDVTVMWINGNFQIGDWGSIVERGNYD